MRRAVKHLGLILQLDGKSKRQILCFRGAMQCELCSSLGYVAAARVSYCYRYLLLAACAVCAGTCVDRPGLPQLELKGFVDFRVRKVRSRRAAVGGRETVAGLRELRVPPLDRVLERLLLLQLLPERAQLRL